MASSANLRELQIAFGKGKQTDISTANLVANMWAMKKLDGVTDVELVTEDDAAEYGKKHEFAENTYPSHWNVSGSIEKYLTAEAACWIIAFGLGKVTKTGSGPYVYTCTPLIGADDGTNELPYFSFVEQIRPGTYVVLDRMLVGCAINSWRIMLNSGPGRQAAKLQASFIGSGKKTEPSGITIPANTSEVPLPAAAMTVTINGTDYVAGKGLQTVELGMDNNLRADDGFFPGSGTQAGAAIRGRLELGDRVPVFNFRARYGNGSAELTKLEAQTSGTANLNVTADSNNSIDITWQKVKYKTARVSESNGLVTVDVTVSPQYDATNGLITAVGKCAVNGICQ